MRCAVMVVIGWVLVSGCATKTVDRVNATREEARRYYAEFIQEMSGLKIGQAPDPNVKYLGKGVQQFPMRKRYVEFTTACACYMGQSRLCRVDLMTDWEKNDKPDRAEVIRRMDVVWFDICSKFGLDPNVRYWDDRKNVPAKQPAAETEGDCIIRGQRHNGWYVVLTYSVRLNRMCLCFSDCDLAEQIVAENKAMRKTRNDSNGVRDVVK